MTQSERQLPRVSLEDLDITDVIQTLRASGPDINAMYDPQDTVENNLINGPGSLCSRQQEEAQTMRFQVMSVLTDCPHHVSADFRNISAGVKRWVRLKGKGNGSDFMVSKFQCHMEDGLFHVPVADVLGIYDRILQWDPYWTVNVTNYATTFRLQLLQAA